MHWWYLLIVIAILLVTIRVYVVPNNAYINGGIIRALVTWALIVAFVSSCAAGILAKHWP